MDPRKKESAYLHLPTYTAGLIYHGGTFVSFLLFALLFFFGIRPVDFWKWLAIGMLSLSGISGLSILVKRIVLEKLRSLSSPDDYLSNILLTIFQLLTLWMLLSDSVVPFYYLWSGLLLLYMPVGKLKHVVYFFAARVHSGLFYGRRGIWPAARP
jgi:nitrate reductase gamma subunit